MKINVIALFFLSIFPIVAYSNSQSFFYNKGELKVKLSNEDLGKTISDLKNADAEHIPHGMEGGSLFEAELVEKLPSDKFGQSNWLVKLNSVILPGDIRPGAAEIKLTSPKMTEGGINFLRNKKYKIFAVKIDGNFYTWKGLSVESGL
ncbi:hypothetical protein [Rhodanobacter sp. MP1X3]|uniref:hypothetical protein n=1 Tax=Rhodanobacter sp. MP1X3 TaxID=2723086 RepID=UPI001608AC9F|nr:hypothetical protein [Rhodanobacter sp. MP1X3]MBB6244155.1 hypothetical protein [Rhodanobacter sp. MP1X3]